jgi:hypothetical protein
MIREVQRLSLEHGIGAPMVKIVDNGFFADIDFEAVFVDSRGLKRCTGIEHPNVIITHESGWGSDYDLKVIRHEWVHHYLDVKDIFEWEDHGPVFLAKAREVGGIGRPESKKDWELELAGMDLALAKFKAYVRDAVTRTLSDLEQEFVLENRVIKLLTS